MTARGYHSLTCDIYTCSRCGIHFCPGSNDARLIYEALEQPPEPYLYIICLMEGHARGPLYQHLELPPPATMAPGHHTKITMLLEPIK